MLFLLVVFMLVFGVMFLVALMRLTGRAKIGGYTLGGLLMTGLKRFLNYSEKAIARAEAAEAARKAPYPKS